MKPVLIFVFIFFNSILIAQYRDLDVKVGGYTFISKFDTVNYTSKLTISKNNNPVYSGISDYTLMDVKEYDLDDNGEKEFLLDLYSGGAHCCTYLVASRIMNEKFEILDTIEWGNSFYKIEDLNGDNKFEIVGVSDQFAYAFTNYAQSEFNILIYGFENNKFIDVTKNFPAQVEEDINEHLQSLKQYSSGFECPNADGETFNTDAGAVKAILAPIVADYFVLGKVSEGYKLVNSFYKCPDKKKFIQTLENEYKLK